MLLTLSYLIDGVILSFLLLVIAKVDMTRDFMRPMAVVFAAAVGSILVSMLIPGQVGAWLSLVAYLAIFYNLLSWLFDLEPKKKRIVLGTFIVLRIVWSLVLR
jgi:hypothetical protein